MNPYTTLPPQFSYILYFFRASFLFPISNVLKERKKKNKEEKDRELRERESGMTEVEGGICHVERNESVFQLVLHTRNFSKPKCSYLYPTRSWILSSWILLLFFFLSLTASLSFSIAIYLVYLSISIYVNARLLFSYTRSFYVQECRCASLFFFFFAFHLFPKLLVKTRIPRHRREQQKGNIHGDLPSRPHRRYIYQPTFFFLNF